MQRSFFRATLARRQATASSSPLPTPPRTKTTTGLTGLAIHPAPIPHLLNTYSTTLALLSKIPPGAVYRQAAEAITKERVSILETLGGQGEESDIANIERKIGAGVIEEVITMAEGELKLAAKMIEWKAWEELEAPVPKGQWEAFKITPSTTTAEDLEARKL